MSSVCPRCNQLQSVRNLSCPVCVASADPRTPTFQPYPRKKEEDVRIGEVLDQHWRVEDFIGMGGMGTVVRAHDLALDRKVAVKILARHLSGDPDWVARFMREAQLTAKLDHPHIVPIYAVGTFRDRPYLVMKLLEGESLSDLLKRHTARWPWSEARPLVEALVSGLEHLHERGLVHRDVKPGNVFISAEGHVTLLDFGLLKAVGNDLTAPGVAVGTYRFMPPEQLLGHTSPDARADLYALATIVFLMLTGKPVFEGDDYTVSRAKVEGPVPRAAHVPQRVAAVLTRALAKERERRFPSVRAFFDALDDAYLRPGMRSWQKVALGAALAFAAAVSVGLMVDSPPPVQANSVDPTRSAVAPVAETPAQSFAPPSVTTVTDVADAAPREPAQLTTVTKPPNTKKPGRLSHFQAPATRTKSEPVATQLPQSIPSTGAVSLSTHVQGKNTYADIVVDGVRLPEATPTTISLPVGKHRIKFEKPGWKPEERTVVVVGGKTVPVVVELRQ